MAEKQIPQIPVTGNPSKDFKDVRELRNETMRKLEEIKNDLDSKTNDPMFKFISQVKSPTDLKYDQQYQKRQQEIDNLVSQYETENNNLKDINKLLAKKRENRNNQLKTGRTPYIDSEDTKLLNAYYQEDNSIITYSENEFFGLPLSFTDPELDPISALRVAEKENENPYMVLDPNLSNTAQKQSELFTQSMPYIELSPCSPSFDGLTTGMMKYTPEGDQYRRFMSQKYGITLAGTSYNGENNFKKDEILKLKFAFDLANSSFSESFSNDFGNSFLQNIADNITSTGISELAFLTGAGNVTDASNKIGQIFENLGMSKEFYRGKSAISNLITKLPEDIRKNSYLNKMMDYGKDALFGQRFVFPQVWQNSSYNCSCVLRIVLMNRAPGTIEGVKKWIIGPLALLMSFVTPRTQTGLAYQYPWLCSYKIPGIIESKCGYVKSLSIERFGPDKLDVNMLPTLVEIRLEMGELYTAFMSQPAKDGNIAGGGMYQIPSLARMLSVMTIRSKDESNMAVRTVKYMDNDQSEIEFIQYKKNIQEKANESLEKFAQENDMKNMTDYMQNVGNLEAEQERLTFLQAQKLEKDEELYKNEEILKESEQNVEVTQGEMNTAQNEYDQAVSEFGEDSPQAIEKKEILDSKTSDYQMALEENVMAQETVNTNKQELNTINNDIQSSKDILNKDEKAYRDAVLENEKIINDQNSKKINQSNPIISFSGENNGVNIKNILSNPISAVNDIKSSVSTTFKDTGLPDLINKVREAKTGAQSVLSNYQQAYSSLSSGITDVQSVFNNILSTMQEIKNGVYTISDFPDELKTLWNNNVGLGQGQMTTAKDIFKF